MLVASVLQHVDRYVIDMLGLELVCVPLADAGLFRYFTFYRKKNAGLPPHLDRPRQPACPASR